ncbi:Retrovirus-related Pol polyprotein from transposon TNT 1-94 [Vitis vinifera]|uniref:Retrovirus-related Pol polyprotein from transposon TNT 1-94 n=1 Tax=Vitis vinifera TaxID=29760 RepID=A0A438C6R3_VITVI|nr:Retrovirus-related Pol polyprotein from transposon TNT 1-94 [Vitis vinifera]
MKKGCTKFQKWLEKKGYAKPKEANANLQNDTSNNVMHVHTVFKAEVEKRCGKQIKIVRTDKGGEYYGRYTEDGQALGLFAKFLQEHGTIAQYTKSGSSNQNDEMNFMASNGIWNLVELPDGAKAIGWLQQIDVKIAFLSGNLEEEVYLKQLKGFSSSSGEHLCPKNDLEREQIKNIPYVSTVGILMYAQVCTRPAIAFVVGMLGRYQSNLGINHWKVAKKVMRSSGDQRLQLMYRRTDNLEVISYFDSDYVGYINSRTSTSDMSLF